MKPTEHGHAHHSDAEMHNADVAHEHSDIDIRAILMSGVGLVVIGVAVALLMWGMFVGLERYARSNDPQLSPVAQPAGQLPPEPRLLTNEFEQLRQTREAEAKVLNGYGWTDQATGVAHVPIEEAKKLLVERGVPARAGAPVDPRLGTYAPAMGEASGGRMLGAPLDAPGAQPGAKPATPPPAAPHGAGGH
jgi:hypothetical protein